MSGESLSPNRCSGQIAILREDIFNMISESSDSVRWCWKITRMGLDVLNVKASLFPFKPIGLGYRSDEMQGSGHLNFWRYYLSLDIRILIVIIRY